MAMRVSVGCTDYVSVAPGASVLNVDAVFASAEDVPERWTSVFNGAVAREPGDERAGSYPLPAVSVDVSAASE